MKTISFVLFVLFSFCALTCKKESPVGPSQPTVPDTTSHNFTFQTFTFGGNAGSCVLSDVAIISDTNIWAVGAIYLDSADGAPDPFPYNVAHWDGNSWKIQRIPYSYQGQPLYGPIHSIFGFNANDIWLDPWFRWDGQNFTQVPIDPILDGVGINRMWGNLSEMYVVGTNGFIAHYTNGSWTKISSGTTLTFNDIFGSGGQILAVCSQDYPAGQGIFSIAGNSATQISASPIDPIEEFFSVWFVPNQQYYVVGDGIYQKNSLSDSAWRNGPLDITHDATTRVRGNNINDVFVVGAFGEFLHWNGVSWRSYMGQTGLADGSYTSVAVEGNLVVAVGANDAQAVITMGRR
jgi:hypothetical protein